MLQYFKAATKLSHAFAFGFRRYTFNWTKPLATVVWLSDFHIPNEIWQVEKSCVFEISHLKYLLKKPYCYRMIPVTSENPFAIRLLLQTERIDANALQKTIPTVANIKILVRFDHFLVVSYPTLF